MQITMNFKDGATPKDIATQLRFQAGLFEGMEPKAAASRSNTDGEKAEAAQAAEEKAPATTAKKTATKKAAKVVEPEETFDLEASEAETEETSETEDAGWSEETEEEKAPAEFTKKDVIAQLQAYSKSKTGSREKAIAFVKKYAKSGNVNDVAEKDYAALMKLIGG